MRFPFANGGRLKVRGGVVEELGIADGALTASRSQQSNLMHSFY